MQPRRSCAHLSAPCGQKRNCSLTHVASNELPTQCVDCHHRPLATLNDAVAWRAARNARLRHKLLNHGKPADCAPTERTTPTRAGRALPARCPQPPILVRCKAAPLLATVGCEATWLCYARFPSLLLAGSPANPHEDFRRGVHNEHVIGVQHRLAKRSLRHLRMSGPVHHQSNHATHTACRSAPRC